MAGLVKTDPVSIETAISSPAIIPGDILELAPGTYTASVGDPDHGGGSDNPGKGIFDIRLHGTAVLPITIRPETPGTVRINGGFQLLTERCSNIIIQDLEISPTPTTRDMPRDELDWPDAVYCTAEGCQFLRNYIHDGVQGMSLFNNDGILVEGNVVMNHGWYDTDDSSRHGAATYTHNHPGGSNIMNFLRNIWYGSGDNTIDLWSASSNNVVKYLFKENAVIENRLFLGSVSGLVDDNEVSYNHVYGSGLRHGWLSNPNLGANNVLKYNVVRQTSYPQLVWYCKQSSWINNIFWAVTGRRVSSWLPYTLSAEANTIENNDYYSSVDTPYFYNESAHDELTIAEWQGLGHDLLSTFTHGSMPPSSHVYPFTDPNDGGLIIVWNTASAASYVVDVSSFAGDGETLHVRNGQDPYNDVQDLLVAGGNITIDMQAISHSVAPITGTGLLTPGSTFPIFGSFMVWK